MIKSKYLVMSSFYFKFDKNLSKIIEINKLFKNQNILDLSRFDKLKIIGKSVFSIDYDLNFIYLPKNIEIIDNFAFYKNQIQILDLSNCIKLKSINEYSFRKNKIKYFKLPKNIEIIDTYSFKDNEIKILNLSNYTNLKNIASYIFEGNQIKHIKLSQSLEKIYYNAFENNKIEILDLSNCIKLKNIDTDAFSGNSLKEIKILNNIKIDYHDNNSPWNNFVKYYNENNKKAGDYIYINNKWQWYPL